MKLLLLFYGWLSFSVVLYEGFRIKLEKDTHYFEVYFKKLLKIKMISRNPYKKFISEKLNLHKKLKNFV